MLTLLFLYAAVALLTATIAGSLRRDRNLEVFVADCILGGVGAWVGGIMFGAIWPVIGGISILACFSVSLPLVVIFNAVVVPVVTPTNTSLTPTVMEEPEPVLEIVPTAAPPGEDFSQPAAA